MKHFAFPTRMILLFVTSLLVTQLLAQPDCVLKKPVWKMDFGQGRSNLNLLNVSLPNYREVMDACPNDGFYALVQHTGDCFSGDWFTLTEDHSPGDQEGNMMLVNASEAGGMFYKTSAGGLKENTTYEFGIWLMNICRINGGCPPLPPLINIVITTSGGRTIGNFNTGLLAQTSQPQWKQYVGLFHTGKDETSLDISIYDNTLGGCGNDFAMDDLTLLECVKAIPVVTTIPKNISTKKKPVTGNKIRKPPGQITQPEKYDPVILPRIDTTKILPRINAPALPLPAPIATRSNPVVRTIETDAGEIIIRLYDNGEIDGDTVSIYHNNELVVSRAGLSQKPVSISIHVDAAHPHHELIMVAENLGSIPPNTSLMIISTAGKRYEVSISSTEQKNAKVVIELKE